MRSLLFAVLVLLCTVGSLAQAQCEYQKIRPTTPVREGRFGTTIAADGGTLVVGSNSIYAGGGRSAVVLERSGGIWSVVAELPAPASGTFSCPVALSGDTILLGESDYGNGCGVVHAFERAGGIWSPTQVLHASSPRPDAAFGRRLVIDGDRAAIAAPLDPTTEDRGGAVFVFERIGGVWTETARLTGSPVHAAGFYGLGLALDGDLLAVGEPGYPGGSYWPRLVHVYRHQVGGWVLETTLSGGLGTGRALSLDNGLLAVGACYDGPCGGGCVHVYDGSVGWQQTSVVTHLDADPYEEFGYTVLLRQDRLIVGTGDSELLWGDGRVFDFDLVAGTGMLRAILTPHGPTPQEEHFGCSLALEGGSLFIGSPGDNTTKANSGAVYAYDDSCSGENYCDSIPNSSGQAATLGATASYSVTQNDFTLVASNAPASRIGMFFYGASRTYLPFGNGYRCVSFPLYRLNPPSLTNSAGSSSRLVDFTAPPAGGGAGQILAGSTWHFQFYFRDPAGGGALFNLSDGFTATFAP